MKSNIKQVVGAILMVLQLLACIGNLMGGWKNSVFYITSLPEVVDLLLFLIIGFVGLALYLLGNREFNQQGPTR